MTTRVAFLVAVGLLASASYAVAQPAPPFLLQWGSAGSGDGQFLNPSAIAVAPSGHVYVADKDNHRVEIFDSNGAFLTQWSCGACDVWDLALEPTGNVLLADHLNSLLDEYTPDGSFLRSIGAQGTGPGQLDQPMAVDVDAAGNIRVVNNAAGYYCNRYAPDGTLSSSWIVFTSFGQPAAGFGCAAAGNGDVFVSYLFYGGLNYPDESTVRRRTSNGDLVASFVPGMDLGGAWKIHADPSGNLYVVVTGSISPRIVELDGQSGAVLSAWGMAGSGPGEFKQPADLALDAAGNLYVLDGGNNRVQKFGSNPTGALRATWGSLKSIYR